MVYRRLFEVLTDVDARSDFPRLSERSAAELVDILRATKEGLPEWWG